MLRYFSLEYWFDDGWHVGRLKEVPRVFSQGETLQELEENIEEVYRLMREEEAPGPRTGVQTKEIGLLGVKAQLTCRGLAAARMMDPVARRFSAGETVPRSQGSEESKEIGYPAREAREYVTAIESIALGQPDDICA